MALDEVKRVFSTVFPRDLRSVEPGKQGLLVGESLRIYDEPNGPVLRFLAGTDWGTRKSYTDKLEQSNVDYRLGPDFTL